MEDNVKNGRVYRAVRPDHTVLFSRLGFCLIPLIAFSIAACITYHRGEVSQTILCSLCAVVPIPVMVMIWMHFRRTHEIDRKRFQRLSVEDFMRLETELFEAEEEYDTFYFLKDALFAPGWRTLLFYREIEDVQLYPSAGAEGITAEFITQEGHFAVNIPAGKQGCEKLRNEKREFAERILRLHRDSLAAQGE